MPPKKQSIIIALTFIILIALGVGYYFYVDRTAQKNNSMNSLDKTLTESKVDNWKTYRNEKYAFEIQYPRSWDVTDGRSSDYPPSSGLAVASEEGSVYIVPSQKSSKESLEEYINKFIYRQEALKNSVRSTSLGSKLALEVPTAVGFPNSGTTVFVDLDKGVVLKLTAVSRCDVLDKNCANEKLLSTFKSILSTFKIIELNDTSNWKTYKNEKWGFEVKLPPDFLEKDITNKENTSQFANFSQADVAHGGIVGKKGGFAINIRVATDLDNYFLGWVSKQLRVWPYPETSLITRPLTIADRDAIEIVSSDFQTSPEVAGLVTPTVYIQKDNSVAIEISAFNDGAAENQGVLNIIRSVVKTLKFNDECPNCLQLF